MVESKLDNMGVVAWFISPNVTTNFFPQNLQFWCKVKFHHIICFVFVLIFVFLSLNKIPLLPKNVWLILLCSQKFKNYNRTHYFLVKLVFKNFNFYTYYTNAWWYISSFTLNLKTFEKIIILFNTSIQRKNKENLILIVHYTYSS